MFVSPHLSRGVRLPAEGVESRTKALLITAAALEKQAEDVLMLDVHAVSTIADFFVIGTAGSVRQLSAILEHVERRLKEHGLAIGPTEGLSEAPPQWMLMDCGDVIIHLFDQDGRRFYRLEDLWADAPRLPLPA